MKLVLIRFLNMILTASSYTYMWYFRKNGRKKNITQSDMIPPLRFFE